MKIGVPGEFHEDRWQRTAEDSERCMIPRTREAGGAHRIQVIAWRRETSDRSSARRPCPQMLQGHPRVAKGASGRSLARPPCPQLPQGHPRVAKSHLTKDKPVSARCKDRLSYRRAYRQTYRMVSYVGLTDRQTGHPYRPPYRQVSSARLSDLQTARLFRTPDRTPDRQPDRPTLPTALPEALAGRVTWVILTGWFYTPDLPAGFVPAARPASLTSSPTGSLTGQPHQPATPASPTSQPDRPARPSDRPALPAGFVPAARQHPHPPSTPAKVPPAGLTGRLRSAGRRLRGWR